MRYSTTLLPLAATARGIMIPDEATMEQLVLETEQQVEKTTSSWWDNTAAYTKGLLSEISELSDTIQVAASNLLEGETRHLENTLDFVQNNIEAIADLKDFLPSSNYITNFPGHPPHHATNLTVYQSIKASNYTTKFSKLVDEYPDLVEKLNSTSANVTLFVPTDHAFEKIPDHHKDHKPPKEFIEKILEYHVLPGFYPAGRVLAHHTLPTALEEEQLGGRPQRVRVSVGLLGLKLNFYSKIVYANLITANGVVHGVNSILVPPPPARLLISLFPSKFSTLELAAEKTGFTHHHDQNSDSDKDDDKDHKLTGLTVFAPTNKAFQKLGPRANAFLFNTDKGLHFLRALLAYHVVVNETLYSDEYYGPLAKSNSPSFPSDSDGWEEEVEEQREAFASGARHWHLDLPTLLGDKHIAVDVTRWFGFVKINLNGHVPVAVPDGLARDGVVQVVDSVLIPPRGSRGAWDLDVDGEIPVEELVARLSPYVGGEESESVGEVGEL